MGRHTRSACRPDAVGSFAQAASVLLNSQLLSYRAAVDDLVTEADRRWRSSGLLTLGALVAERLKQPEFASVLSRLDGGVDVVAARFLGETRKYSPGARDSASDLLTFARVFLLAQIDSAWWGGTAPFVSDKALVPAGGSVSEVPPGHHGWGSPRQDPAVTAYVDLLTMGDGDEPVTDVGEAARLVRAALRTASGSGSTPT